MMIEERHARALAHLVNGQRPDWPVDSLMTLLGRNRDVPSLAALTIAAMTKALEPSCKTPAPIFHPGPHWPAEAQPAPVNAERCADHPTFEAHNCRCCWSEVKAGERSRDLIGQRADPTPTGLTPQRPANRPLSAANRKDAPPEGKAQERPAEGRTAAREGNA